MLSPQCSSAVSILGCYSWHGLRLLILSESDVDGLHPGWLSGGADGWEVAGGLENLDAVTHKSKHMYNNINKLDIMFLGLIYYTYIIFPDSIEIIMYE